MTLRWSMTWTVNETRSTTKAVFLFVRFFFTLFSFVIHWPLTKMTDSHHLCLVLPKTHTYTHANKTSSVTWNCFATRHTDDFYHVPVSMFLVFLSGVMMSPRIKMQQLLYKYYLGNPLTHTLTNAHNSCNQWLSCTCHYLCISSCLQCRLHLKDNE